MSRLKFISSIRVSELNVYVLGIKKKEIVSLCIWDKKKYEIVKKKFTIFFSTHVSHITKLTAKVR